MFLPVNVMAQTKDMNSLRNGPLAMPSLRTGSSPSTMPDECAAACSRAHTPPKDAEAPSPPGKRVRSERAGPSNPRAKKARNTAAQPSLDVLSLEAPGRQQMMTMQQRDGTIDSSTNILTLSIFDLKFVADIFSNPLEQPWTTSLFGDVAHSSVTRDTPCDNPVTFSVEPDALTSPCFEPAGLSKTQLQRKMPKSILRVPSACDSLSVSVKSHTESSTSSKKSASSSSVSNKSINTPRRGPKASSVIMQV
jgi:hypothetical protein